MTAQEKFLAQHLAPMHYSICRQPTARHATSTVIYSLTHQKSPARYYAICLRTAKWEGAYRILDLLQFAQHKPRQARVVTVQATQLDAAVEIVTAHEAFATLKDQLLFELAVATWHFSHPEVARGIQRNPVRVPTLKRQLRDLSEVEATSAWAIKEFAWIDDELDRLSTN